MEHMGLSLYLLTGTSDVIAYTDIVYGTHCKIHLSQTSLFLRPSYQDSCNSGTVCTIAILSVPLCRAIHALQRGTDISISNVSAEWSIFSNTVT